MNQIGYTYINYHDRPLYGPTFNIPKYRILLAGITKGKLPSRQTGETPADIDFDF